MPVTIEPMQEQDIEAVARLRIDAFFEGTARTPCEDVSGLRELMSGDGFEQALVARSDGAPIGTVLLIRHELDSPHGLSPWLAGLVVAKAFQRRGVGTALVRAIEAHACTVGVQELYLYTWQAQDFYGYLGWETVEAFEQDGEPMLLMVRSIVPACYNLPVR